MPFVPQQEAVLSDSQRHDLGRVAINRVEGIVVFGEFFPGSDYGQIANLFADYVDAANEGVLSVVGELDTAIARLGLGLETLEGATLAPIYDVQIGGGSINFRVLTVTESERPFEPVSAAVSMPTLPIGQTPRNG